MMTRNNVFYNLENSIYFYEIGNIKYVFSSKLHLYKFKQKILSNRDEFNIFYEKKLKIICDLSVLSDLLLYDKIETRGFLIYINGVKICQKNRLILNGEISTL